MRIGIFGGTFNPIHLGHLLVAQDTLEKLRLDTIIFIPAFNPPHKTVMLPYDIRKTLVKMAIRDNPNFQLSEIEKKRGGKSFTIDTLKILKKDFPTDKLFFIMGIDQYLELDTWKEPEKIFQMVKVAILKRPGYSIKFKNEPWYNKANTIFLDSIEVGIKASDIRKRIRNNLSIRYLVPDSVLNYIKKNRLYKSRSQMHR